MSPIEKLKKAGIVIGIVYAVLIVIYLFTRKNENIDWAYIFTLYNAIIVFVLLYLGLKSPVVKMLDGAAEQTAKALREARAATTAAKQFERNREEIEAQLEEEKDRLMSSFTEQIKEETEKVLAGAQAEARQVIEDITKNSAAEYEQMKREVQKRILADAFAEAEKLMRDQVQDADKKRVFEELVADLETSAKAKK